MQRFSSRWLAWGFVAAMFTRAEANAAPQLTWQAPVECPRGAAVLTLVRDIVGEDVWLRATLHAEGSIVETSQGYRLELRMEDAGESDVRTLDAKVCRDLLGAAAVVLGLNLKGAADIEGETAGEPKLNTTTSAVEGTAQSEGAEAASGATVSPDAAATPTGTPPPKPGQLAAVTPAPAVGESNGKSPAANRSDEARFWLGLPQVSLGVGSLPKVTWSLGAALGVRFSEWATWLSARYQLPQVIESDSAAEVGVEVLRCSAELGASRGWRAGALELGPSIFIGVDYLTARGTGADVVSTTAARVVPSVGAGVVARVALGGLVSLSGTLCGEVPLARPRFLVDSFGDVGQLGAVQGRFAVATEWKF